MSEYMGLITGGYEAKKAFQPGMSTIHNQFVPHGPDAHTVEAATLHDTSQPERLSQGLAFMFESSEPWEPTQYALENLAVLEYPECWSDIPCRTTDQGISQKPAFKSPNN